MKYENFVTLEIIKEYTILGGFFWQAMQHVTSSFPDQGSNLCPLQWKHKALTTERPGNTL